MNIDALNKISYGLFVLIAKDNQKMNGCIVNTVTQVTNTPNRIAVTVNKKNYTSDMILSSGVFNVSTLSVDTTFEMIKNFGFISGRDNDKFSNISCVNTSENGLYYLTDNSNSFISAKVAQSIDVGTHMMYISDVTDAQIINDKKSLTYEYYHSHIKPKAQSSKSSSKSAVWRCTICGYEYDESKGIPSMGIMPGTKFEDLPDDFVCPLCKHPKSDFVKV